MKRSFPQVGGAVSASSQAISYVNDLSASAQAQLNTLREGSATANNAISAKFANSASKATVIASLSGTFSVVAANVPDLTLRNTFTGVITSTEGPIRLSSTQPGIVWNETDAGVDTGFWRVIATGGSFLYQGFADDGSDARTYIDVNRNANSITDISISCSNVFVNSFNVLSPPALNGVAAAAYARLDIAQTFSKGTGSTIVALTDGSTISPNCEDGNVFRVVLGGNRTMAAPSNPRSGQTLVLHVLQDGTGGRTLAWNSIYRFAGSTDPTLTTIASARDVFAFNYDSTSNVWAQAGLNVG